MENKFKKIVFFIVFIAIVVFAILFVFNKNNDIKSIQVVNNDYKKVYYVGDDFIYDDIQIIAKKNNGKTELIDIYQCSFEGFDSSNAIEDLQVIIKYEEFTCSIYVNIINRSTFDPELTGLSIKKMPENLNVKIGGGLDVSDGILLCEYSDGTTKDIPLKIEYIEGFQNTTEGPCELTIKYREGTKEFEVKITITIIK